MAERTKASIKMGGRLPSSREVDRALRASFEEVARERAEKVAAEVNEQFHALIPGSPEKLYEVSPGAPGLQLARPEYAGAVKGIELGTPGKPGKGIFQRAQAEEKSHFRDLSRAVQKKAREQLFGKGKSK